MRKKALAVSVFSVLFVLAWVYVLNIRVEVFHHLKVPLMLIHPALIPLMVCFVLSLWALAFRESPRALIFIASMMVIAVVMVVGWMVSVIGAIVAVLVIACLLSRGWHNRQVIEHESLAPVGVWLIAAINIVAGYSALAPALLSPISSVLNVPELSHISNVLLFAFGISLLITAFGVITMKKTWFYITIGLSALSIGVFSWVPLFSLFPMPIFYPAWLVAVSPLPVEIPVIFYLFWKRDAFLKAGGKAEGNPSEALSPPSPKRRAERDNLSDWKNNEESVKYEETINKYCDMHGIGANICSDATNYQS